MGIVEHFIIVTSKTKIRDFIFNEYFIVMTIDLEIILVAHNAFALIMPIDAVTHTPTAGTTSTTTAAECICALVELLVMVVVAKGMWLRLLVIIAATIVCTHYLKINYIMKLNLFYSILT